MARRGLGPLAVLVVLTVAANARAGQLVVPARVLERPDAVFPLAAKAAGVEGDVRFRAVVDANGRVESVEILSVPQTGLGFEDAVKAAVSRWRFSAALLRGAPTTSEYTGAVHFSLTLSGQAIFSASSKDTWAAVRAMVRQLKIPVDKADDAHQLLTSDRVQYLAVGLPDQASLGLPPGFKPDRLVFHVYVTPGMEPARVSVGSVMELEAIAPNDTRRLTIYAHDGLARWFLDQLARRMAVRSELLSASAEGRAAQATSLMPPGLTDPCATKAAALVEITRPTGSADAGGVARPQLLEEVRPHYPGDQLQFRKTTVIFHGEITEHGTLINPTMTEPVDVPRSFVTAAQVAFGLWRFAPPQRDGCPVRTNATFESLFSLR